MRAVGFDFDHTLGIDQKLERDALLDVLEDEELQEAQTPETCIAQINEALQCYRSGAEELDGALIDLFARTLEPNYDPAELIERFKKHAVELAPKYIQARPGVQELLERLAKAGIGTAILTNGWAPLQNEKAKLVGFSGPVFVSDELGIRKPDPRAFSALQTALNVPAAEILFVGDSAPIDIAGAMNFGMQAAWYNWENQSYPKDLPPPTYTIADLSEVAEIVLGAAKTR